MSVRLGGPGQALLLVLSMLSGCAANDFGGGESMGTSHFTPTGAFGAYLEGRFAARRADLDLAAEKLEQAARQSGNAEVEQEAFLAALLAGRPEAPALAARLHGNAVAQLVVADQNALAGRWAQAEAGYAALPQQGPTQVLQPLLVAWAEAGGGRTAAALTTLQPLVESGRLRGIMALHAGLIADLGGEKASAARYYGLAQAEYGAMNLRLAVVLASWEGRAGLMTQAQAILRELAGGTGELGMARPALEADAVNLAVRNATDGIAETYLAMGATLRQQNALDSAQILLRLALTMRSDLTAARLLLSDIQQGAKRPAAALQTLAPVPESDPLIAPVRLRRAALEDALGHPAEATRLLEAMSAAYPDRAEPLAAEGDVLRRQDKFREAVGVMDRAIARLGTPSRAGWSLFYQRGVDRERAGDWVGAEQDLLFALQLAPEQASVLNYLGYAWTERGKNLPQARQMIEKAVSQKPNDGSFVDSLGWAQLRGGDAEGALRTLQKAVELQPEDATINGHLGDAMAALGRWRDAEFQWRRALLLKPDAEDVTRINGRLAHLPGR